MSSEFPDPIKYSDLDQTQCKVNTSVMIGRSGKCYKRDLCDEKDTDDCGETLLLNKKLTFLREADALKKVI